MARRVGVGADAGKLVYAGQAADDGILSDLYMAGKLYAIG